MPVVAAVEVALPPPGPGADRRCPGVRRNRGACQADRFVPTGSSPHRDLL